MSRSQQLKLAAALFFTAGIVSIVAWMIIHSYALLGIGLMFIALGIMYWGLWKKASQ